MRILFFSRCLGGGGAERALSNITSELVSSGHDIYIAINEDEVSYPISRSVHIIKAPQLGLYEVHNHIGRFYRRIKRKHRNRVHTRDAINSVCPDVIVTFLQCNMMPIIRFHGSIPIVHSEHNAYDRDLGWNNYFNRFFLNRFFNRVCVLTFFDQGYAKAKHLRNVVRMPNPNTFTAITDNVYEDLFKNRRSILLCGRVREWWIKGFDLAIKAFSKIIGDFPEVYLDIAGSGDDKSFDQLLQIAEENGAQGRVRFLGRRNNMNEIYQQYQFFVLSSRTEGFPMVIGEAMSQGLPCISFERLASSIIIDGQDGILVNDGDISGLSDAMRRMLMDEKMRYEMGRAAIKNIGRFSREKVAKRWEIMLNELTDKR